MVADLRAAATALQMGRSAGIKRQVPQACRVVRPAMPLPLQALLAGEQTGTPRRQGRRDRSLMTHSTLAAVYVHACAENCIAAKVIELSLLWRSQFEPGATGAASVGMFQKHWMDSCRAPAKSRPARISLEVRD